MRRFLFLVPGVVLDDRGVPREVVRVGTLARDSRIGDPAYRTLIDRINTWKWTEPGWFLTLFLCIGCGVVVEIAVSYTSVLFGISTSGWARLLLIIFTFLLVNLWMSERRESRLAPQIAGSLLSAGICPSCGYGLADLKPEPDGCLVCPECGAAWHLERVARSAHYSNGKPRGGAFHALAAIWNDDNSHGALQVMDELGTGHMLPSPRLARAIGEATVERRDRLRAAARANLRGGRASRWGIAGCLFLGCAALPIIAAVIVPHWSAITLGLLMGLLLLFAALSVLRGPTGIKPEWMKQQMLRHRLCPSCTRDLPDTKPTTRCEHCNAVWRWPS